jgi:hypothetical protein
VLYRYYGIVAYGYDEPDTARPIDITGRETRTDQLLTRTARDPKRPGVSGQLGRSVGIPQHEIKSLQRNAPPLRLPLCVY